MPSAQHRHGGGPRTGAVDGAPEKFGWLARHAIIDLIMTAQEALAIDQVRCLRPGTFLRIDSKPARRIDLDDASAGATKMIVELAQKAVEHTKQMQATEGGNSWRT